MFQIVIVNCIFCIREKKHSFVPTSERNVSRLNKQMFALTDLTTILSREAKAKKVQKCCFEEKSRFETFFFLVVDRCKYLVDRDVLIVRAWPY